ncbi:pyruvate dehydrogenase phosphatase regulatory subunit, mitochondrial-like [Glandiceps talaboti]
MLGLRTARSGVASTSKLWRRRLNLNGVRKLQDSTNVYICDKRIGGARCFSSESTTTGKKTHNTLPSTARVVVCGGGVSGCSVAYHLAQLGWTDVVLLDKGSLTCGTTWHAAGLVTRFSPLPIEKEILKISSELYASLEDKTGHATGYKKCGSLNIAATKDRFNLYKKLAAHNRLAGIQAEILSPKEIEKYHPLCYTDDLYGGILLPEDGYVNPSDLCQALSRSASQKGVKFFENVGVQRIDTANGKIDGVQTSQGYIQCEYVVNCGGMWARDIGLSSEPPVNAPLHACEHYYIVSKPLDDFNTSNLPVLRDYDNHIYVRDWSGGLLMGSFEPTGKPIFYGGIPDKFEFGVLPEDWDHFQPLMELYLNRIPKVKEAEIRQLFVGPESFTPDTRFLFGEAPEIRNYYIAAGYNSRGITLSGGTGYVLADWIVNGKPAIDISPVDIKRFSPSLNNKAFLRDRVTEVLGTYIAIQSVGFEYTKGRNIQCSPLYPSLKADGAVFGEKMGWERPLYIKESQSDEFIDDYTGKDSIGLFGKPPWLEILRKEHKACKEDVCLLDMTSLAKFELQSPGSEATNLLQYLCCGDINMPIGNIVHTAMLNSRGGFENDCSVFRMAHNHYFIVCPSFQRTLCKSWIHRHIEDTNSVSINDVTDEYTALSVIGPKANHLLQGFTATSLNSNDFKQDTGKVINIGYASGVRALAMTHCGEKGWLLYIPNKMAYPLYESMLQRQEEYGIRNIGYYSHHNLRVENSLPLINHDYDCTNTPFEAGKSLVLFLSQDTDFIGKAALAAQKENGLTMRLAMFFLDDHDIDNELWPWGGEPIYRNGQFTGLTTTTAYSFMANKMTAFGWITNDVITSGSYEIEIMGKRYPATAKICSS